jgi:hypothetical protein
MDAQYEKLKQEVEADLGRPLEVEEEIEVKALFYFGKGVNLKNELDSKPERIGDICTRVLADIRRRMERQRRIQHRRRVVSAVGDFMSRRTKPQVKQKKIFDRSGE